MFSRALRRPSAWRFATASGRLASRVRASRRRSSSRSSRIAAARAASPPDGRRRRAAAGGRLVAGAVQAEQDLALDHHVAGANPHARDLAVAIGTHLVLHLHRLDDRQHRAGAHAPAGLDGDSDDAAGKGGADVHDGLGRADEGPAQRTAPG